MCTLQLSACNHCNLVTTNVSPMCTFIIIINCLPPGTLYIRHVLCTHNLRPRYLQLATRCNSKACSQQAKRSTFCSTLKIKTAPSNNCANKQQFSTTIQSAMNFGSPKQCIYTKEFLEYHPHSWSLPYFTLSTQFQLTLNHIVLCTLTLLALN